MFDLVIHRFLELPAAHKTVEQLLDHLGMLYKFHGLYNSEKVTYGYFVLNGFKMLSCIFPDCFSC